MQLHSEAFLKRINLIYEELRVLLEFNNQNAMKA